MVWFSDFSPTAEWRSIYYPHLDSLTTKTTSIATKFCPTIKTKYPVWVALVHQWQSMLVLFYVTNLFLFFAIFVIIKHGGLFFYCTEELVQTCVKSARWKMLYWTRQLACGPSLWKMTRLSVPEYVTARFYSLGCLLTRRELEKRISIENLLQSTCCAVKFSWLCQRNDRVTHSNFPFVHDN